MPGKRVLVLSGVRAQGRRSVLAVIDQRQTDSTAYLLPEIYRPTPPTAPRAIHPPPPAIEGSSAFSGNKCLPAVIGHTDRVATHGVVERVQFKVGLH
jgi:hypothetical protein